MIYNQDALEFVRSCKAYDCIFMDPPDNIGLLYDGVIDERDDYYQFLELLTLESMLKAKVVWLSYYWKHDIAIKTFIGRILQNYHPSWQAKTFIWKFNFGQHQQTDCGSGYRPILRLSCYDKHWNTDAIRVESYRQQVGDARADPRGCVPLDVWEFPRITGNNTERRKWHPTQHPEALMERLFLLSDCKSVLDLFAGTGTSIRVCKKLGIACDAVELSKIYYERLLSENPVC